MAFNSLLPASELHTKTDLKIMYSAEFPQISFPSEAVTETEKYSAILRDEELESPCPAALASVRGGFPGQRTPEALVN